MNTQAITKREDAPDAATSIIQVIERAAMNPDVDIDKIERLLAMRERMEERAASQAFDEAMNRCQEEMLPISQDASNPQTRSKYASYTALDKAMRPIYARHGFSVSFDTGENAPEQHVRVLCTVSHRAGHSRTSHLDVPSDGKGAKGNDVMTKTHATVSAVSYGRRTLFKMAFNIAEGEHDDDGNSAGAVRITDEQADELLALADEVGADKAKFCEWAGVDSFSDIPASKFGVAKRALEQKRGGRREVA